MHAVEFQTTITNGTIELPAEWKGKLVGAIRVILLSEENLAEAEETDPLEKAYHLANQTAAERGARLLEQAQLNHEEIVAGWAAAMREMGISAEPVSADELREMMLADGVNPESNEFSRGIIAMREE